MIILTMISLFFLFSSLSYLMAEEYQFESYSTISEIPEPMVFDLVRELGAKKGEFEINTLLQHEAQNQRLSQLHLSPELEYVVSDGLGIELELPMEGSDLLSYKGAVQKTIGHTHNNTQIHGIQGIAEKFTQHHNPLELTLLYLFGHRLGLDWSYLLMLGDRYEESKDRDWHRVIANLTFFYTYSSYKEIEFALEQNLLGQGSDFDYYRITPEIHIILHDHWKIQMGIGTILSDHHWDTSSSIRIIKEFY